MNMNLLAVITSPYIYHFETYAQVVQWKTIRLMLVLKVLPGLKYNQGDVTSAFLQADLGYYEKLFVDMPRGLEVKGMNGITKVINCIKSLYGLCQSTRAFWK